MIVICNRIFMDMQYATLILPPVHRKITLSKGVYPARCGGIADMTGMSFAPAVDLPLTHALIYMYTHTHTLSLSLSAVIHIVHRVIHSPALCGAGKALRRVYFAEDFPVICRRTQTYPLFHRLIHNLYALRAVLCV